MTREEAVQMIASALEGLGRETADHGRGGYVRQAKYILALAEVQNEWNDHRLCCPMPVPSEEPARSAYQVISAAHGGDREQKWRKDAATDKQLATLRKIYKGKAVPADLSKDAARKLISQFFAQQENIPATEGQLRYLNSLQRQGKIANFPADISKWDAATLIDRAAAKSRVA